jgi:hypothetical protein
LIQKGPDSFNREGPFAFEDHVAAAGNDGQISVGQQVEEFHEFCGLVVRVVVAGDDQGRSLDGAHLVIGDVDRA